MESQPVCENGETYLTVTTLAPSTSRLSGIAPVSILDDLGSSPGGDITMSRLSYHHVNQ